MSQHTPGPWAVYGHPGSALGPEVRAGDRQGVPEDERVCRVDMAVGAYDLALANARLIAAAPDLLEALEFALPFLISETEPFEKARAAIAKATKR